MILKALSGAACVLLVVLAGNSATARESSARSMRVEHDLLGEKAVPASAYYGIQTARAIENFQISGTALSEYPELIIGFAQVRMAAAMAIVALELSGHELGDYDVIEPHDHLNMSQSTNDSYPTALKAAIFSNNDKLVDETKLLVAALRAKGDEFIDILKMGRTEMQDAVPMTLGQEFHAFAAALEKEIVFLRMAEKPLFTVNMGATAIGSGLNAPEGYAQKTAEHLARLTGKPIVVADDLFAATWDQHAFVVESGALRSMAIKLSKIASDLILLSSGPRAGLGEINLPAMQPGSSIMPGKVNRSLPN
jgi:aspartate ammonia-lyase